MFRVFGSQDLKTWIIHEIIPKNSGNSWEFGKEFLFGLGLGLGGSCNVRFTFR